ncbi:hypothetical protein [Roseovarius nanhaiticus]|uniref:DUF4239 domain-containing protein n=1 Tax=Roseovarius nanhaiticus TaxID=573024 RepID=A0A1N7EUJ9_9RHOB|nr:hypothetical protein [Roseovarius nanhaiticus]SEK66518.1 hypothetical protein SAMN05216208_1604 [Roseovarius nanhaiticus]SIR91709.1 hypothetical protein SAMN05421666_0531 [Roseovarius nanhaiticus]
MTGPREVLYDIPSILIALGLLALMLVAMSLSWFLGRRSKLNKSEEGRSQTTAVQGSMLGLLALLLGFTFSLGLSRHDTRSTAVVDEANAIGTAWLRTDFLPADIRASAKDDLRRYTRLRLEAAEVSADQAQRRKRLVANAEAAFADLWEQASTHAATAGGPAAVSYAASLNDMIDALGARDAAIERHVPEVVLFMLFGTFVLSGAMLGFSSGLAGAAPATPVYLMMALIVLLVFMIIDLDRPRRGLIEVDQRPLAAVLAGMQQK